MPLFKLIFLGLGWPWVGEFDGFIIFGMYRERLPVARFFVAAGYIVD